MSKFLILDSDSLIILHELGSRSLDFATRSEIARKAISFTSKIIEEEFSKKCLLSYENPDLVPSEWEYDPSNIHILFRQRPALIPVKTRLGFGETHYKKLERISNNNGRISQSTTIRLSLKTLYNGYRARKAGYSTYFRDRDSHSVVEKMNFLILETMAYDSQKSA